MKPNEYMVLERAVDEGVDYAFVRVYKHNQAPSEDDVKEAVKLHVMTAICEWFSFEGDEDAGQFR